MPVSRPALDGVLETCLYVTDVAVSAAFYTRILGLEPMTEPSPRFCALNVKPGQVLVLFQRGGTLENVPVGDSFIPAHDGGGEQHFAFAVPKGTLDEWAHFLASENVAVESDVHWSRGGRSLYFRDPDRLVVELAEPGVWANY
jgi:catechol 2,3-dioxygenase-like lactoylglutathione lyase family enzyme